MVKVTLGQIKQIVDEKRGTRPVTILAVTDPRLKKTGLPDEWRAIRKHTVLNGMANHIYGNSVNLQRMREGIEEEFTPHPRKWGERIPGTTWVQHKGGLYMELKVERVLSNKFMLGDTEIPRDDLLPFLPVKSDSSRQGTEKAIILRDFGLDKIREIKIGGVQYVLAGA